MKNLELSVEHLEDADLDMASQAGAGLEHLELAAEEVPLLLHLDVEDAGLPSEHQEGADGAIAAGGAVRVRARGAGEGRGGAGGRGRRDGAAGADGREGGAQAAERSEGLEAVGAGGGDHFGRCGMHNKSITDCLM